MIFGIVPLQEKTVLYFENGTIEIIDVVSSKYINKYGYRNRMQYGSNKSYKAPIIIDDELFYPTRSKRNKECVWINGKMLFSEQLLEHISVLNQFDHMITEEMIIKIGVKYLKTRNYRI